MKLDAPDRARFFGHSTEVNLMHYTHAHSNQEFVDGRFIPLTNRIRLILDEVSAKQKALGIHSEWVFCKEDGSWTTTVSYYESLYKVSKKLGLSLSNNHAFRMALNSYVYVPMGLPATERAKLLGHSVDTNLKFYTFARTDDYIDELCNKINAFNEGTENIPADSSIEKATGTSGNLKVVPFKAKEKALNPLKLRLSSKTL